MCVSTNEPCGRTTQALGNSCMWKMTMSRAQSATVLIHFSVVRIVWAPSLHTVASCLGNGSAFNLQLTPVTYKPFSSRKIKNLSYLTAELILQTLARKKSTKSIMIQFHCLSIGSPWFWLYHVKIIFNTIYYFFNNSILSLICLHAILGNVYVAKESLFFDSVTIK